MLSKLAISVAVSSALAACGGGGDGVDIASATGAVTKATTIVDRVQTPEEIAAAIAADQEANDPSRKINRGNGEEPLVSTPGDDLSGHNNAGGNPLKKGKKQAQADPKRINEGRGEGFNPAKDQKRGNNGVGTGSVIPGENGNGNNGNGNNGNGVGQGNGGVGNGNGNGNTKTKNAVADVPAQAPSTKMLAETVVSKAAAPMAIGQTAPVAPPLATIPATAKTAGAWTPIFKWPLIPLHLAMMGDGRLMSYGSNAQGWQTGKTIYDIYTPADGLTNGHMTIPKDTLADLFCSAMIWMPTVQKMLTVGGDVWDAANQSTTNQGNNSSTIFTPGTNSMVAGQNMALPRWYATTTMLPDGTVYIQGGLGGEAYPELRQLNGSFKSLTTAKTQNLDYWYPRNFLNSDGRIFGYDIYGNYYYVTPTGTGTLNIINQWDVMKFGDQGSAVLFKPGMILQTSGYDNSASIIDFRTNNAPTLTPTSPMSTRRQNHTATTLPNGKVLVTGGSLTYNETAGAVNYVEIWDPATGQWTKGSSGGTPRLYHSVAMLQPDGTVLVGGGGAWGPLTNDNVEFYYPPYLFDANGGLATRPVVTASTQTSVQPGGTFTLTVDDAAAPITKVTMIKAPALTHSMNMDQSVNDLTYTRSGNTLTVQVPASKYNVTPGNYMVFAQTAAGVPAQARILKVDPAGVTTPPPALAMPTGLSGYYCGTGCWTTDYGNRFNWALVTGATSYVVNRSTTGTAGPWTQVGTVTGGTYVDKNLAAGKTYFYQVIAKSSTSTSQPATLNYGIQAGATMGNGGL